MDPKLRRGITLVAVLALVAGAFAGTGHVGHGSSGVVASENVTATEEEIDIETDRVSISLQSQQTVVESGDTIVLTHSATNYITNDQTLSVQLILEAPSGSDVSGTGDIDAGSGGQFITTTQLEPGEQESQRIHIDLLEPGEYELTGEAVYFFGDDTDTGEGVEISIPIEMEPPPPSTTERIVDHGTSTAALVPNTYQSLATSLENRALENRGDEMVAMYSAGVIAAAFVFVLTLSPVVRVLTGRSIASDLRYRRGPQLAESNVGLLIMLLGFGLFIVDTSVDGAGAETVWTAHILAGLLVATAVTTVASLAVLTKVHLINKVVDGKLGLLDRVFGR